MPHHAGHRKPARYAKAQFDSVVFARLTSRMRAQVIAATADPVRAEHTPVAVGVERAGSDDERWPLHHRVAAIASTAVLSWGVAIGAVVGVAMAFE